MNTPRAFPVGTGWVEVVTGCMFSGKTEELIRRLNRASYATQRVIVFKPAIDVRYAEEDIVSHSSYRFACIPVPNATEMLRQVGDAQVVGVDEAQFFEADLVSVVDQLANQGRRVVVAGLDQDYRGVPFGPMPGLMAISEYVTKTLAVCMVCGSPANRSQRLVHRNQQVLLGAEDSYEARCRLHWEPHAFDPDQQRLPLEEEA